MNGRLSASIVIAHEHGLFRELLKKAIGTRKAFAIVGEVAKADSLEQVLRRTECDLLLLDMDMQGGPAQQISILSDQTGVIALTADRSARSALALIRDGARAVVLKDCTLKELKEAITVSARGDTWLPADLRQHIADAVRTPLPARLHLTAREHDIIRLVARGLRNGEVARALHVSDETVKSHLNNVFRKLGVRDRVELALYAVRNRIIEIRAA